MTAIGIVGNLARDTLADGTSRPGGVVYHGARAASILGADVRVLAKCASADAVGLLPPLEAFGLPIAWRPGITTVGFSYRYEDERRQMRVDAVGDPWTPDDARGWARQELGDAEWVLVGALLRGDFPAETLAELARGGRKLLLEGHGLARLARVGSLERNGEFDRGVLEHVTVLKLSQGEAEAIGLDLGALSVLGVPEIVVTRGSRGSVVLAHDTVVNVAAEAVPTPDPTGAGDAFGVGYVAARADGAPPADAARVATALAAQFLR